MQTSTTDKALTPREHIQAKYTGFIKDCKGESSKTLADLLNGIISVDLPKERILFELLQNADDAAANTVTINLAEDYLLFANNGNPLEEENVNKLCRARSSEKTGKQKDSSATGYKDIGFKTNFALSDCVYVFAEPQKNNAEYSFRFDRNHFTKQGIEKCPWQIIPVPNEPSDLQALPESFTYSKTNVVLKLRDAEASSAVNAAIEAITTTPQVLLFLKNITTVTLNDSSIKIEKSNNKISIKRDNKLVSTWFIFQTSVPITDTAISWIGKTDQHQCPAKMKDDFSVTNAPVTLTYAVKLEDDLPDPLKPSRNSVFCLLPTNETFGFNFLVNCPFLLSTNRTTIQNNPWNEFLLEKLVENHFILLATIAKQPKWQPQTLNFLWTKPITNTASTELEKSLAIGFDSGLKNHAFLPTLLNPKRLLRFGDAILDTIGFYVFFATEFKNKTIRGISATKVIADNLENTEKLQKLQIAEFNETTFLRQIETYAKNNRTPWFGAKLLSFVYKLYLAKKENDMEFYSFSLKFINQIKNKSIILSQKSVLFKASELYFFPEDRQYVSSALINILQIKFVHSEVLSGENSENTRSLLGLLGTKLYTPLEIVRNQILPKIDSGELNAYTIEIIQFLCQAYTNKALNDLQPSEIKKLKRIKISTAKGRPLVAKQCYLPNTLNPILSMEQITSSDIFVSSKYYANSSISTENWKKFLIWLGTKQNIEFKISETISRSNVVMTFSNLLASSYFTYLNKNHKTPDEKNSRCKFDRHIIRNWLYIDFMDTLWGTNLAYASHFWRVFIANWQKIYKTKITYKQPGKDDKQIISYLQYILQNVPVIKVTNKDLVCKATEAYIADPEKLAGQRISPQMREFIKHNLPLFSLQVPFSQEQIEYLGLRKQLDVDACIKLLTALANLGSDNKLNLVAAFKIIFKALLTIQLSEKDYCDLRTSKIQLLAGDNTLQEIKTLRYFDPNYGNPPANSDIYLKKLVGLTNENMKLIAKIFNVAPNKQYLDFDFSPIDPVEINELKEFIVKILPALAIMVGHNHGYKQQEDYNALLQKFYIKISKLCFFRIKGYSKTDQTSQKPLYQARIIENQLYLIVTENDFKSLSHDSKNVVHSCIVLTIDAVSKNLAHYLSEESILVTPEEVQSILVIKKPRILDLSIKQHGFGAKRYKALKNHLITLCNTPLPTQNLPQNPDESSSKNYAISTPVQQIKIEPGTDITQNPIEISESAPSKNPESPKQLKTTPKEGNIIPHKSNTQETPPVHQPNAPNIKAEPPPPLVPQQLNIIQDLLKQEIVAYKKENFSSAHEPIKTENPAHTAPEEKIPPTHTATSRLYPK